MIKKPITINLSTGLEARPVAQLVQVASQFNSEIYVEIGKKRVNAKSIMGMMTLGLDKDTAGSWCSLILILFSVILTGCNLYSKIGRFGGAGSLVPITGFANSVASSAIEYKAEGQVFGIGCKIFTIAGPVILYGILSSWILGVIYYLFTMIP